MTRKTEAGFSLVEVTLALLVVAVGMTAAFALFPEAIRSTRSSVDNTETALFADYVFSTLDLTAGYESYKLKTGKRSGTVRASGLDNESDQFMSYLFNKKARTSTPNFEIHADKKVHCFYWMPQWYGLLDGDTMDNSYFDDLKTAVFTYWLSVEDAGAGTPITAVLKVWPGEYADLDPDSVEAKKSVRIFYREILPPI